MKTACRLLTLACLSLAGCQSSSWPPSSVALDPQAVYVTGESDGPEYEHYMRPVMLVNGKIVPKSVKEPHSSVELMGNDFTKISAGELALKNASLKAKGMGIPSPMLSEIYQEPKGDGVRILYRVVNQPTSP